MTPNNHMTPHNQKVNDTMTSNRRLPNDDHDPLAGSDSSTQKAPVCAIARFGVVAMVVALMVTSIMTLAAEAQLPSTTPGPDGSTAGTNSSSSAGVYIFAVVVLVIVGGAVVLYLRNRKKTT